MILVSCRDAFRDAVDAPAPGLARSAGASGASGEIPVPSPEIACRYTSTTSRARASFELREEISRVIKIRWKTSRAASRDSRILWRASMHLIQGECFMHPDAAKTQMRAGDIPNLEQPRQPRGKRGQPTLQQASAARPGPRFEI